MHTGCTQKALQGVSAAACTGPTFLDRWASFERQEMCFRNTLLLMEKGEEVSIQAGLDSGRTRASPSDSCQWQGRRQACGPAPPPARVLQALHAPASALAVSLRQVAASTFGPFGFGRRQPGSHSLILPKTARLFSSPAVARHPGLCGATECCVSSPAPVEHPRP